MHPDQTPADSDRDAGTSKRQRLLAYLRDRARRSDGDLYLKSRVIAEDLALSAREVGIRMGRLADDDGDERDGSEEPLFVEKWAYSNGTTWRIGLEE